jgi:uncharacterized membrane-anchored protein
VLVEEFSNKVLRSKIINTYVATAFFAVIIFFTLNADSYTPVEMLFGVIFVTIAFKGLSHMMIALIILLYDFDHKKESMELGEVSSRINGLLNDLSLQQTKIKSQKIVNEV